MSFTQFSFLKIIVVINNISQSIYRIGQIFSIHDARPIFSESRKKWFLLLISIIITPVCRLHHRVTSQLPGRGHAQRMRDAFGSTGDCGCDGGFGDRDWSRKKQTKEGIEHFSCSGK